jgi:8-oxo-dGTP pyrophosphatase MutT (NUDIX family)
VLVPVFEEDGEAWLLLTRRAQHLRNHRGEVSFPGGRRDDDEALIDTAKREALEEIGLDPSTVEIVGELDHLVTFTSKAAIVPYVGVLPARPIDLKPNPDEVELVITVPFSELLHEDTFREELWHFFDEERPMYFFEVVGDTIWGATARILYGLLELIVSQ